MRNKMFEKKSILIIDDHPTFREGLKSIIKDSSTFDFIGEAGNGKDGFNSVLELQPDIAVIDISLPDINGIQLADKISSQLSSTRIIILSMHSRIDYIIEAFRAGVLGYMSKSTDPDRFLQGIEAVSKGEFFLDGLIAREVIETLLKTPKEKAHITNGAYETLTPREQEIMRLLAGGLSTLDVAQKLYISRKTVENHRTSIMQKLNLKNSVELVRLAAKLGLVDLEA